MMLLHKLSHDQDVSNMSSKQCRLHVYCVMSTKQQERSAAFQASQVPYISFLYPDILPPF